MDFNRFQVSSGGNNNRYDYDSYGEEDKQKDKGVELKYKVAEGLEFSIPVQQIGQAAVGALFNVAKNKVQDGFRDMIGEENYNPHENHEDDGGEDSFERMRQQRQRYLMQEQQQQQQMANEQEQPFAIPGRNFAAANYEQAPAQQYQPQFQVAQPQVIADSFSQNHQLQRNQPQHVELNELKQPLIQKQPPAAVYGGNSLPIPPPPPPPIPMQSAPVPPPYPVQNPQNFANNQPQPQETATPQYEDDDIYDDEEYNQFTYNQPKFYQTAFYAPYFNVSTMDVLNRLRKSLWPFCTKNGIYDDDDKVDLYGPIWIMITLIVEIAIVGFINHHIELATLEIEVLNGKLSNQSRSYAYYSLDKVAKCAFVVYFYFLLNPLFIMLIVKYTMNIAEISFLWLFGIYGYSYTIFVLTTILNVVPLEWLRWAFVAGSGLVSLCVIIAELVRNLREKIVGPNVLKFGMLCLFLVGSHTIFVVSLKRYFLVT